jgi:hypothetical protein
MEEAGSDPGLSFVLKAKKKPGRFRNRALILTDETISRWR